MKAKLNINILDHGKLCQKVECEEIQCDKSFKPMGSCCATCGWYVFFFCHQSINEQTEGNSLFRETSQHGINIFDYHSRT